MGTAAGEILFAFGGADSVYGGSGNDLIDAGNGEDLVNAGPGDDRIRAFDRTRDVVRCGPGSDIAYVDRLDDVFDCEDLIEAPDRSPPPTPDPRPTTETQGNGAPAAPVWGTIVLEDESWLCHGPVDVDLVKVTIYAHSSGLDAVTLGQNCSGRIGRIEVDTWSGDGIKVQNSGNVAHDLVIESGIVRCHSTSAGYHQDGVQVMGGHRLTFRNMTVLCGGPGVNAALFIARGGSGGSTPTEVVFENGHLGPGAAHTILLADSTSSGARNTVICPGRFDGYRVRDSAVDPIMGNNTVRDLGDPHCQTK